MHIFREKFRKNNDNTSAEKYLIAVVLEEFHFLLREGGHGDGLDPVGRIEAPPGTHNGDKNIEKRTERSINNKCEKIQRLRAVEVGGLGAVK